MVYILWKGIQLDLVVRSPWMIRKYCLAVGTNIGEDRF